MKTNKQRADIILERYQKNKETQNQQNINKVLPKKHRWFNLKAFAYSMAATLVIIGVSLGLFLGLRQNDLDLSKMYILNFDKYVAIGAGSPLTNDEQVSANVLSFDANSTGKNYMIGVDQYGNVEKLRFALNNNTSETDQTEQEEIDKQDWQVSKIKIFERFIVVEFNTFISTSENFWLNHTYVIDNETGKMYYLNNSDETNYIYFVSEDTNFFDNEKEGIDMEQTKDSIYFYTYGSFGSSFMVHEVFKVYVKNDELVVEEVYNKDMGLILKSYFVDKYDNFMFPIRQTVAELDTKLGGSRQKDPAKAFWDIASQITSFRDGMHSVIDEFSKGISPSDEDFKFFTHTVQAVLIPYMNQTKGEVNDTFIIGVRNLDTFFWKIMTKAIENSQEKGEKMDEIVGLAVRVTQKELDNFLSENKELADENLADEIENASSSSEK